MKDCVGFMDLYHIYSVRKYKDINITGKMNILALYHHSRLDHLLPSLDQFEVLQISF
jgi:hypothetical protein